MYKYHYKDFWIRNKLDYRYEYEYEMNINGSMNKTKSTNMNASTNIKKCDDGYKYEYL